MSQICAVILSIVITMTTAGARRKRRATPGESGIRRKRSPCFTFEENEVLVQKICQYHNCVFGAAAKRTSQGKKRALWVKITDAVNSVGANGRPMEVIKKRYFDIKCQITRRLSRAKSAQTTGGRPPEADLSVYERKLFAFLGLDEIEHLKGSIDTDAPIPSRASEVKEHAKPSPEPHKWADLPPQPTLTSFSSVPSATDFPKIIAQDAKPSQHTGAAESLGSTTALSPMDDDSENILKVVETNAAVSGAASKPTRSLGSLEAHLRGVAEEIRQYAIPSHETLEREREVLRQHLQCQAATASLLSEIEATLSAFRTQYFPEMLSLISQLVEVIKIIGARMLGTTPELLFPSFHARPGQQDQRSEGDEQHPSSA